MATYLLILKVTRNARIAVGRLEDTEFKRGLCLYIGSAKRGLDKRIARHRIKQKKLYWHIDYILSSEQISVLEVWTKEANEECAIAHKVSTIPETEIVRNGIGSSDCKCATHLYFFEAINYFQPISLVHGTNKHLTTVEEAQVPKNVC